jgi:hypothetical protein
MYIQYLSLWVDNRSRNKRKCPATVRQTFARQISLIIGLSMANIGQPGKITKDIRTPKISQANTAQSLDKNAQKCTAPIDGGYRRDKSTFQHKAKQKHLTQKLMIGLVNVEVQNKINGTYELSRLNGSYWRTYNCGDHLLQYNRKISFQRCKNRFCLDCNGYRTAKLISGYLHQIEQMEDPYFVTLSRRNCRWDQLPSEIDFYNHNFAKIRHWFKTRKNRGFAVSLDGIKKVETTFNLINETFHPHFHFIVDGRENAYTLLGQWMRLVDGAGGYGQDIKPADSGSIKELFKYMTKFWKVEGKGDQEKFTVYNPNVLDYIMRSMKGRQVFKSFGRIKIAKDQVPDSESLEVEGIDSTIDHWSWDPEFHDWVNTSGEVFADYNPTIRVEKIYQAIDRSQRK